MKLLVAAFGLAGLALQAQPATPYTLEQVLSYPEDTAGRLMNPDVVTVRAAATIGA